MSTDLLDRLSRPKAPEDPTADVSDYHRLARSVGDIDPSYSMLLYLRDRFELNREQCFWLAFLYSTTYCGASTFYLLNEFPDYETLDHGRLSRWWTANKSRVLFQSDRLRIKTGDKWVDTVESYRDVSGMLQGSSFWQFETPCPRLNYELATRHLGKIRNVGRFTLFLLTEAIHILTGFPMRPASMDLRDAVSCRNGLALAIGRPDLNTHGDRKRKLDPKDEAFLQREFDQLVEKLEAEDEVNTVWSIETTLCAYKKWQIGKRWIGFYLDRQHAETVKMEAAVREGVDWSVLWQYREETFDLGRLKEKQTK